MNKKVFLVIVSTLLLIFIAGCSSSEKSYPEPVMKSLEAIKHIKAATTVEANDKMFIIVSMGPSQEKNASPKIDKIEEQNGELIVTIKPGELLESDNNKESFNYVVKEIKRSDKEIKFHIENDYLPRIYGIENVLPIEVITGENIVLFDYKYDSKKIHVSGIASIWEASFFWELKDSKGNVLNEGNIMAKAGAPDWGYFELNIGEDEGTFLENASTLVFLEENAKTGEHEELLKLNVTTNSQ